MWKYGCKISLPKICGCTCARTNKSTPDFEISHVFWICIYDYCVFRLQLFWIHFVLSDSLWLLSRWSWALLNPFAHHASAGCWHIQYSFKNWKCTPQIVNLGTCIYVSITPLVWNKFKEVVRLANVVIPFTFHVT